MSDRIAQTPIVELPEVAERMPAMLRECGVRVFMMNGCRILLGNEPQGWHLSISRTDRDPTWGEIATARYRLLAHVPTMAMFLPPLSEYVNVHPYTFHLHEDPPRCGP